MPDLKYGLNSQEAQASLQRYGNNALTPPPRVTFWQKLWENFQDPIIRILLVALCINIFFVFTGHGDVIETVGICVAVLLATLVSTISEYSNESSFQKLQEEASKITCKVWRDGILQEIGIDDIVQGDYITLEGGDKVPVDGVLVSGTLKVDQAALNGESEEATKITAPESITWGLQKADFLDVTRVYRGSVVVDGQGILKACAIGDSSVYGQLTQELRDNERESPLKLKLKYLADQISIVGYAGGLLIMLASLLRKMLAAPSLSLYLADIPCLLNDVVEAVILGVIIIVMAVPEGLPLMIAIVSSRNMQKMLNDNVLVRRLIGIETAGSLNLLFTDKTGTITKGHLEVVDFLLGTGESFPTFAAMPTCIKDLIYTNCAVNTSATVVDNRVVGGNMTEVALGRYIGAYTPARRYERELFVPFNSARKYSYAKVNSSETLYFVKGAPERLILRASYYTDAAGEVRPLTEEMKAHLDEEMVARAKRAIRMLGLFTCATECEGESLPEQGLILTGIACIRDDVRPEAVAAIREVKAAGVQVVMITGDRKETAVAIATDAGLLTDGSDLVWTSDELARMTDAEVAAALGRLRVVSRALPMDKSRLVGIAQSLNLVVGMTGDGVNDSPALKKADVGFAMGSGTEVAKEAGDIVILDDNFLSIEKAILYGRTIYNSICKFIVFQLTINFSAVALNFLAPFLGIEKPLTITQILWVNLVMDTLAAMAFGGEPALAKYLREPPKRRDAPIISRAMGFAICCSGIYITLVSVFFFLSSQIAQFFRSAPDNIYLYTGFFCTYIFLAVVNGFCVRTEGLDIWRNIGSNRAFLEIMGLIVVVQIAMTYVGGRVLRVAPLTGREWQVVVALALSIIVVDIVRKLATGKGR